MFEKKYAINYIKNIVQNNLNNSFSFPVNLNPNLSIIIPLYNCQNTIKNTIFSVETQNFNNFEIILINDNSQDNNFIFKKYRSFKCHGRIYSMFG